MGSDVQPREVSELIERGLLAINDGYRAKNSELGTHGLPFARGGNINGGFNFVGADRFPEENLGKVGEKVSRPGDAVFTSKGTVGRFAFVTPDVPTFVYSPQLCYWRSLDHSVINPRWLYYWMYGSEFFGQYSGVKGQTDMADYVSLRDQRRMHITLPPIRKQQAIAEILGALDDKIELNRQTNRTLETMARAVFKAWFVDFEPVKAKAAGATSFRGMPQDVFDQLPARLTESELGPVPEGWTHLPIGDLVEVVGGGTPSTKNDDYWVDGQYCWATPKDLAGLRSPVLLDTTRKLTDAGLDKISSGLLPPGTVLLSSRAPIGYLAVAEVPVAINQGFIAMKPNPGVSNLYLLYWAEVSNETIVSNANGSTFLEISKKNFRPIPVINPGSDAMMAFDEIVSPIFRCMVNAEKESALLSQLRDHLLPRLISGQLSVAEAEEAIEDVV